MGKIDEYSYIWESDIDEYVLLYDEFGYSILSIKNNNIMFFLIEDSVLFCAIVKKMICSGNKIYASITELKDALGLE